MTPVESGPETEARGVSQLAEAARRASAVSDDGHTDGSEPEGKLLMAITNRIVGLYKEHYGKGPTKARTYLQDNLAVCLLSGGFTRVEATLRDSGRGDAVVQQRNEFQSALETRFRSVVEELTGRRVLAFMSGTDERAEVMCELFVLEPPE